MGPALPLFDLLFVGGHLLPDRGRKRHSFQRFQFFAGLVQTVQAVEDHGIKKPDVREIGVNHQDAFQSRGRAQKLPAGDLFLGVAGIELDIVRILKDVFIGDPGPVLIVRRLFL